MSARLLVSIVSWNTRDELARCLTALQECNRDMEVVVVDNDSSDGSADMVARSFPSVRLIRAGRRAVTMWPDAPRAVPTTCTGTGSGSGTVRSTLRAIARSISFRSHPTGPSR